MKPVSAEQAKHRYTASLLNSYRGRAHENHVSFDDARAAKFIAALLMLGESFTITQFNKAREEQGAWGSELTFRGFMCGFMYVSPHDRLGVITEAGKMFLLNYKEK